MPLTITRNNLNVPTGPFEFIIDNLPVSSLGFVFTVECTDTSFAAPGLIADVLIEIRANASLPWDEWIRTSLDGAPSLAKGNTQGVSGRWPGVWVDGTRSELKQAEVRISGMVYRAFFTPRLELRPI